MFLTCIIQKENIISPWRDEEIFWNVFAHSLFTEMKILLLYINGKAVLVQLTLAQKGFYSWA